MNARLHSRALLPGPAGGWDNVNPTGDKAASAFVIEWSNDRDTPHHGPPPVLASGWIDLRKRAALRVAKDQLEHGRMIQGNGKSLDAELEKC